MFWHAAINIWLAVVCEKRFSYTQDRGLCEAITGYDHWEVVF
jgi:hypothetical protein